MAKADWQHTDQTTAEGNPRRPEGAAGRAMLARMNESHARLVDWGLGHLTLRPTDTVLDIGCGGGSTLARIAERVPAGHLVGIDYAETAVEASRAFNAALIESGRMEILHGSVEALPFGDGDFDAAVTVESFYFWPSPEDSLREVARVMRRSGSFLLLAEICGRDDLPEGNSSDSFAQRDFTRYRFTSKRGNSGSQCWGCGKIFLVKKRLPRQSFLCRYFICSCTKRMNAFVSS